MWAQKNEKNRIFGQICKMRTANLGRNCRNFAVINSHLCTSWPCQQGMKSILQVLSYWPLSTHFKIGNVNLVHICLYIWSRIWLQIWVHIWCTFNFNFFFYQIRIFVSNNCVVHYLEDKKRTWLNFFQWFALSKKANILLKLLIW